MFCYEQFFCEVTRLCVTALLNLHVWHERLQVVMSYPPDEAVE